MWTDDELRELLRRADEGRPAPDAVPKRLAERIVWMDGRRRATRRVRRSLLATTACLLLIALVWTSGPGVGRRPLHVAAGPATPAPQSPQSAADGRVAALRRELAVLDVEARLQARMVNRIRDLSSVAAATASAETRASQLDPLVEARLQCGQAAAILLQSAAKLSRLPDGAAAAARRCRWVIELYPGSIWADEARELLRTLESGDIS